MSELPAIECLRERLRYEPDTGLLFWKDCVDMPKNWRSRFANKEAFTAYDGNGYKQGAVNYNKLLAHRVAWSIHFGEWPVGFIDHINGVVDDNRIINLRVVSNQENHCNRRMQNNNTSDVTGVVWHKAAGKWSARIKFKGKQIHLGLYQKLEEAAKSRKEAAKLYGFTERHGVKEL